MLLFVLIFLKDTDIINYQCVKISKEGKYNETYRNCKAL